MISENGPNQRYLTTRAFDVAAVLVERGARESRREAPLGVLLNRIKRMRMPKRAVLHIAYGAVLFDSQDIEALINSEEYETWLRAPRLPLPW
jgi:hypothetical protein